MQPKGEAMKAISAVLLSFLSVCALAQAPGTVREIRPGIHVYAAKDADSNVTIMPTSEGVVMIDTGQNVAEARVVESLVKKLSPLPVRFIVHTEPHNDHTIGDFLFSPPATVIAAAGAVASMRQSKPPTDAGYRLVLPHVEYQGRMTLHVGERTIELINLKNVHSEADTGVWLPKERIVFAAATVGVNRFPNLRPFLTIPDILAAVKLMRGLGPEIVVPGHGAPGTTAIFDETERYYAVLLDRVGKLAAAGSTLEQAKTQIRLPEFDHWSAKERFPTNVDAAWRALHK
jgi:cyclase